MALPSTPQIRGKACSFFFPKVYPSVLLLVAWANKNHLSLLCKAPTLAADIIHHLQSYPNEVISLTTRNPPRVVIAGTFSKNMNRGSISLAKRRISKKSPLRFPSKPFPCPAIEISWHSHGNPPKMISTSSVSSGSPVNLIGSLCLCHSWWHF